MKAIVTRDCIFALKCRIYTRESWIDGWIFCLHCVASLQMLQIDMRMFCCYTFSLPWMAYSRTAQLKEIDRGSWEGAHPRQVDASKLKWKEWKRHDWIETDWWLMFGCTAEDDVVMGYLPLSKLKKTPTVVDPKKVRWHAPHNSSEGCNLCMKSPCVFCIDTFTHTYTLPEQ